MRRLFFAAALWGLSASAFADTYPSRPVTLVVPAAPGGIVDVMARAFGESLSRELGQAVVVQNRDGGANVIGTMAVAKAVPDGYTIAMATLSAIVLQPHLKSDLSLGPDSLDYLCQTYETPTALFVSHSSPIHSMKGLIELAATQTVSIGTPGTSTVPDLALVQLEKIVGIKIVHVPFRGEALGANDLIGGHIQAGAFSLSLAANANLRPLAILAPQRIKSLPNLPTAAEQGYPISALGLASLFAPPGLPAEVREKLTKACRPAFDSSVFQAMGDKANVNLSYAPSAEISKRVRDVFKEYGDLLRGLRNQ